MFGYLPLALLYVIHLLPFYSSPKEFADLVDRVGKVVCKVYLLDVSLFVCGYLFHSFRRFGDRILWLLSLEDVVGQSYLEGKVGVLF